MEESKRIARLFHKTYERLAPEFGYTTRDDTKEFDEDSPNGKLMMAVCKEVFDSEISKAKREGIKEALNAIVGYTKNMRTFVNMFNPISENIMFKQSGELDAYDTLLQKLESELDKLDK
jgi:hypothetical protein